MAVVSREFQVFAKPAGSVCNLRCSYSYYLKKENLFRNGKSFRMSDDILEQYIIRHIEATDAPVISFSWRGGEQTLLGLDYFRRIIALQNMHKPAGREIRKRKPSPLPKRPSFAKPPVSIKIVSTQFYRQNCL